MLVYGKWQFWAAGRDKGSKVSRLESLKQVEKTLGKKPKQLEEAPELRDCLDYIWSLFVRLRNASDGPISYTEIQSYMDIYGRLAVFEIDAIMLLDSEYRKEVTDG